MDRPHRPTDRRTDGPNDPLRDRYKRKTEVIAGAEGWNHWWWQCDLVSFKSWILMIANHEQLLLCYKWNHKKWNEGIICARTKGRRMVLSGRGKDWANENNWIETLLNTNEKQLEKKRRRPKPTSTSISMSTHSSMTMMMNVYQL